MATKPSTLGWGGTTVNLPPGKLAAGFAAGERPGAQIFNTILGIISDWHTMLDAAFDAAGAPRGRYCQQQQHWYGKSQDLGAEANVVFCEGWNTRSTANAGASTGVVGAEIPAVGALITVKNAAASEGAAIYPAEEFTAHLNDDSIVAVEFDALLTAVGSSEVDVFMGLHVDPDNGALPSDSSWRDPTSEGSLMLRKLSGDTNWQFLVGTGSAGSTTDTGVPPVVNTAQFFRLEFHGAATPLGVANSGAAVARAYIDGTLVATITSNVPTGGGLGLVFEASATATGPSADVILAVGPVRTTVIPDAADF